MIKLEICEKIIDSKVVSIKKIGINEDKIKKIVLSNNGKQFTLYYKMSNNKIGYLIANKIPKEQEIKVFNLKAILKCKAITLKDMLVGVFILKILMKYLKK